MARKTKTPAPRPQVDDGERLPVVKATVVSTDGMRSNSIGDEGGGDELGGSFGFKQVGILTPPHMPNVLCDWFEQSNSLRQNVDAYETNIDAFGHRFNPVVNPDGDDADEKVKELILTERLLEARQKPGTAAGREIADPTEGEIEKKKNELRRAIRMERLLLEHFFNNCTREYSFVGLRRRTRKDLEITGNAYWEIVRDGFGDQIAEIKHVPARVMRVGKLGAAVQVKIKVRATPVSYQDLDTWTQFRTFAQVIDGKTTFFKQFGDRRTMSSKTGKVYETPELMQATEKQKNQGLPVKPATEIMHFAIYSPKNMAYGVPRWIGNKRSVLGSIQAEELNLLVFNNKMIPPIIVAVDGGRLAAAAVQRLKDFVQTEVQGKKSFYSALVLEAVPAETGGNTASDAKTRIRIEKLWDPNQADAMFMKYDEANRNKVGEAFRNPPILRGDTKDANRSTTDNALKFAEEQVYSPERTEFDYRMDNQLLPELGIVYHEFVSNGPVLTDPGAKADIIKKLENVLTIEESRKEAAEVIGRQLPQVDEPWTKKPAPLVLEEARSQGGAGGGDGEPGDPEAADQPPADGKQPPKAPKSKKPAKKPPTQKRSLLEEAASLASLRDALAAAEGAAAQERFKIIKTKDEDGREMTVVQVPADVMAGWFTEENEQDAA